MRWILSLLPRTSRSPFCFGLLSVSDMAHADEGRTMTLIGLARSENANARGVAPKASPAGRSSDLLQRLVRQALAIPFLRNDPAAGDPIRSRRHPPHDRRHQTLGSHQ